jgi:formyl-CoA transferase
VIKIEAPEGDLLRSRQPIRDGASTSYGQLNAGKQSVVLDLKQPEAQAAIYKLLPDVDVVVENFRPGVMRRFGLDYPALSALKPDLIYCAISGYGQTGPSAGLAAYAPAIHAASGPDNCGVYVADVISGTYAFGAIASALFHRQRTGQGQMIDVSMLEATLSLLVSELQAAQFIVPPASKPLFGPVRTKDGFIMPAVASERTFVNLARAAGREDWITDPRFAVYVDRRANWGALIDELESWSTQLSTAECQAAFDHTGVPSSPYRTVRELMSDPQLAHRGAFAQVEDAGGAFRVLNPPFRMSATQVQVAGFAAALGEHTSTVLRTAGCTEAEIAVLLG